MRVIKGQTIVKKKGDTKWPHAPLAEHPVMSRGELAKRHAADVVEKAQEKEAAAFVTSEAEARRIAQENLDASRKRGNWKDKFKKKGGA